MDRDNNQEKIEKHFKVMVFGVGLRYKSASEVVEQAYKGGITDEFIEPAVIEGKDGELGLVRENDAVIFANFRSDRAKQIAKRFLLEKIPNLYYVAMTQYDDGLDVSVAFPSEDVKNTLADVLSANGLRQMRITETEKFSHLTFFFNAQRYEPVTGEDRIIIDSNKDVHTHDEKPEMKAREIVSALENELVKGVQDFIAINLVNCDMVGHSGNFDAIVRAVEEVDTALGAIEAMAKKYGAHCIITADHGNAEETFDPTIGQPLTSHTLNPVPFILISDKFKNINREAGFLSDIAPTVLQMLGFEAPSEMTGRSFLA